MSQHLYAGNSLQMQYQNTQTSFYSILSAASQISHARSASRLNQVMLTFGKADVANSADKSQTQLLYPVGNALKARLTIGEKRMPATEDLAGPAMFYRKLMQSLGNRAPSISREAYEGKSFIVSFDCPAFRYIDPERAAKHLPGESLYACGRRDTTYTTILPHRQ